MSDVKSDWIRWDLKARQFHCLKCGDVYNIPVSNPEYGTELMSRYKKDHLHSQPTNKKQGSTKSGPLKEAWG